MPELRHLEALCLGDQAVEVSEPHRAQNTPCQPPPRRPLPRGSWNKQTRGRPLASELRGDPGLAWEVPLLTHAPGMTPRDTQEKAPRGLLFLFTKTLLSDMLDKKNYSHNRVMPE